MARQDQTQKCSNSSSGGGGSIGGLGKSSRKPKQKKVPQRGLGVAQLEKIRIEEQQRKEAAASIFPTLSSVSPSKSSYLPLPVPNFHHPDQLSVPCGSPADFTRLPLSLQNMDGCKASSTVISLGNSGKTFEAALHSIPVHGHGNVPKLCDFEKEFLSSMSLPYKSNPTWLFPDWTQRTQQYQQPSSSMVNVSSGTLSSPVHDYSIIEPPSNQNYSSTCVPLKPEEKQMMGLKRSYPFSLDVPSASSLNFKLPTFTTFMKTNETGSCGSGTGLNFDAAANSTFREVPSCSTLNSEPNSKKSNKENENFSGDFLTLAPPTPPSKLKSSSTFLAFHNQEYPDFESPSSKGKLEDQIPHGQRYGQFSLQQQPLHSFFPPKAATQIVQTTTTSRVQNCNGGNGEIIDLNLKL